MKEVFIQVLEKFKEELQVLVESLGYATTIVHNCRKFKMRKMV
jgi:hypothetical protein